MDQAIAFLASEGKFLKYFYPLWQYQINHVHVNLTVGKILLCKIFSFLLLWIIKKENLKTLFNSINTTKQKNNLRNISFKRVIIATLCKIKYKILLKNFLVKHKKNKQMYSSEREKS